MDFVGSYLSACFAEGIDVTSAVGLAKVLDRIGLNLAEVDQQSGSFDWQGLLQENIDAMNGAGLWGCRGSGYPPPMKLRLVVGAKTGFGELKQK